MKCTVKGEFQLSVFFANSTSSIYQYLKCSAEHASTADELESVDKLLFVVHCSSYRVMKSVQTAGRVLLEYAYPLSCCEVLVSSDE